MADRRVFITGGTGGLGGAVTAAFQEAGWRMVVPVRPAGVAGTADAARPAEGRTHRRPERTPSGSSRTSTDPDQVAPVVADRRRRPGAPLRAVVNLVGGYAGGGRVHETPIDEFDRMITLNLRPTYLVTRQALPHWWARVAARWSASRPARRVDPSPAPPAT